MGDLIKHFYYRFYKRYYILDDIGLKMVEFYIWPMEIEEKVKVGKYWYCSPPKKDDSL